MKNVKSMFAAITLGLILSCSAYAGDVNTPGFTPPPPPPTVENSETTAPGEINTPGLTIEILLAALSALY